MILLCNIYYICYRWWLCYISSFHHLAYLLVQRTGRHIPGHVKKRLVSALSDLKMSMRDFERLKTHIAEDPWEVICFCLLWKLSAVCCIASAGTMGSVLHTVWQQYRCWWGRWAQCEVHNVGRSVELPDSLAVYLQYWLKEMFQVSCQRQGLFEHWQGWLQEERKKKLLSAGLFLQQQS